MQANTARCRTCGAEIIWKKTATGKNMPCEAYPITIVPSSGSKFKALDRFGKLIPCVKVDQPGDNTEIGWEPHWGNCNNPDAHRRR